MPARQVKETKCHCLQILFYTLFLGQVTSFFSEKNRNIAGDLLDILNAAHQQVPEWLEGLTRKDRKDDHSQRNYGGNNRG